MAVEVAAGHILVSNDAEQISAVAFGGLPDRGLLGSDAAPGRRLVIAGYPRVAEDSELFPSRERHGVMCSVRPLDQQPAWLYRPVKDTALIKRQVLGPPPDRPGRLGHRRSRYLGNNATDIPVSPVWLADVA